MRWLSVLPRTLRNVALRNVDTSAMKYSTSRRSITPRAMLEKWVTGLSDCSSGAIWPGSVTPTASKPISISTSVTNKPSMNEII